jgi:protein-S-isoprenylcysteine O-methyltransferase Ste14
MTDHPQNNPGVIAPPPLIYAGMFLLGIALHTRYPLQFKSILSTSQRTILGGLLIGSSVTLVTAAIRSMKQHHTNINPAQPATTLVVEGPFKLTRNPIYIALTLFYTGLSLLINTFWTLFLLPIVLLIINKGVIDREEQYLEDKFGEQYKHYKMHVRRWI